MKYNREEEEEKNRKMKEDLIKNKDKKRSSSNKRIKQELNNTFDYDYRNKDQVKNDKNDLNSR